MTNINYHTDVWILDFVEARIAEDEARARAVIADDQGEDGGLEDAFTELTDDQRPRFAEDLARLTVHRVVPRRVLAECVSKRALIEAVQDHAGDEWEADPLHRTVLLALAAAYSDHPDYEQDWAL